MHFTDNHLFEVDGDTCQHKCFLDFKVPSPDGSVASVLLGYEDVVVKVDGEWLFKRRGCGLGDRLRAVAARLAAADVVELWRRTAHDGGEDLVGVELSAERVEVRAVPGDFVFAAVGDLVPVDQGDPVVLGGFFAQHLVGARARS